MEAKIVELDAMVVVGIQSFFSTKYNIICKLWGKFTPRENEIKDITNEKVCFGLCFDGEIIKNEADPKDIEHQFFYLAGLSVKSIDNIPEGMTYKNIPAHKYAKFTHKGSISKLGETYNYIFVKWLAESEYKYDEAACDIEWYDERFKPDSEDSEFDIYVPIL